jgi:hypothetical protein
MADKPGEGQEDTMRIPRITLGLVLSAAALAPANATAQQAHVLDRDALDRMVAGRVQQDEADRRVIRDVLQRQEVREVARRAGLDLIRAEAAVSTLSGNELKEAADRAREVNDRLAGGANVTISTTTIIILLLVVILIIVAVD